jgi:hypothetical protein
MANPDVTRLINSEEIQSVVRPAKAKILKRPWTQKKNPLVNKGVLFRLNPYAKTLRRQELCKSMSDWMPLCADDVFPPIYSEAGATEEEWGKEGEDMLCWGSVLDDTQGSMIPAIVLFFANDIAFSFVLLLFCVERLKEVRRSCHLGDMANHLSLRLHPLVALQKVDSHAPHRHE